MFREISSPGIGEVLADDRDFSQIFVDFPWIVRFRTRKGAAIAREVLLLGRDGPIPSPLNSARAHRKHPPGYVAEGRCG